MTQTTAVFVWTVAVLVLGFRAGVPWVAVFPLLIGAAAAWLTASWRRLAEWVAPVLVVIEIGVLFLCAWSTLEHALTLGSLVFGSTATALLALLALPSSRAGRQS